jgi:hypothetical protein
LAAPHRGRDEAFHLAISELLEEWARVGAPDQPAVQIVGKATLGARTRVA